MERDTIFALATPPGRSGVAVIRLSGPAAGRIAAEMTARELPPPRVASLRRFSDEGRRPIDEGLLLWFQGPASFTGEDSAEFQIHGGQAIIEGLSERLVSLGARVAEAGEFTRRAFEHGQLDLTEAEGLADLIDAETRAQREQAFAQMTGALRILYDRWRQQLLDILAAIEGEIDFPDEESVPDALAQTARPLIDELIGELDTHLDDGNRGERIRDGYQITIIGPPNAGKSSLLNALAGREAAIVTDIPGTTRDIVEVRLVLGGYAVTLADTAGLRETQDVVESEGVRRALTHADSADLVIGVLDASDDKQQDYTEISSKSDLIVLNKIDLVSELTPHDSEGVVPVSARSGEGLTDLLSEMTRIVSKALSARDMPALSRARHRQKVETARNALARASQGLGEAELAGEDVRLAVRAMEGLTGRIEVEDVLGEVFSRFCIGK